MDATLIALAAHRLRPNQIEYSGDTYDSIVWRCDNPPQQEELENEAQNIAIEIKTEMMRVERNALLASSDWTQSPDSPLSDAEKTAWANYRQQLRDFPSTWTPAPTANFPEPPA